MKKIKYGNRKNEGPHQQLNNLKEGDQICEGVLDTLSDDYLSYITHLVKQSKTPVKKHAPEELEQPSSDSQPLQPPQHPVNYPYSQLAALQQESKHRHHSQTGPKRHEHLNPHPPITSNHPQSIPRKLSSQKETINRDKNLTKKAKKNKMDGYPIDLSLKNQQKTMSFTRNMQQFKAKEREDEEQMISLTFKGKGRSSGSRCYTNSQQSEISRGKISIQEHMGHKDSQRDSSDYPFIFEIDNYISHLETNPQPHSIFTKKSKGKDRGISKGRTLHREPYKEEYSQEEIHNILKENLKLNKRVKSYQEKIQQLEDEVSTHLIQCKGRDKNYRHKISDLVKALTQAASKINHQKQQITSMKQLLRTFGQKVKQIQHQQEDSDQQESDIGESIIRYMEPPQEPRTKQKRGLESTMPRHDDDRKYWCD